MDVTIRADETVEISGYVNAVGRESRPLRDAGGWFTETIEPGAFSRALSKQGRRPMLLNHDHSRVLAVQGDNLELREDAVGLYARAVVSDPEVSRKARENRLRGWSFGFRNPMQDESDRNGIRHRSVTDMELTEVSIIDDQKLPCYPATSVITRADGDNEGYEVRSMDWQDVSVVEVSGEGEGGQAHGPDPKWAERVAKLRAE